MADEGSTRIGGATRPGSTSATTGGERSRTTDQAAEPPQNSALDRRYESATRGVRATAAGRLVLKAVVFVVGLIFVAGGVALAVLPGPLTIPPVLVGVYVWSLEFGWARRLRVRVSRSAKEAWASAKQHPARAAGITVAGLVVAGVVIWAVVHYDLVARATGALT